MHDTYTQARTELSTLLYDTGWHGQTRGVPYASDHASCTSVSGLRGLNGLGGLNGFRMMNSVRVMVNHMLVSSHRMRVMHDLPAPDHWCRGHIGRRRGDVSCRRRSRRRRRLFGATREAGEAEKSEDHETFH